MVREPRAKRKREENLETPERIVAAALRLFSERGFDAVSLRDITAEAKANIAAVNYHFTSKDGLIAAVLESRMGPVNAERLAWLDELEQRHRQEPVPVRDTIEAYLGPLMSGPAAGRAVFLKFVGRMMADRGYALPEAVMPAFREVVGRYVAALQRSLPAVPPAEIYWRLHFSVGAMAHTLVHGGMLRRLSENVADDPAPAEKLRRVVAFCAAGFAEGAGVVSGGEAAAGAAPKKPAKPRGEEPKEIQGEFF